MPCLADIAFEVCPAEVQSPINNLSPIIRLYGEFSLAIQVDGNPDPPTATMLMGEWGFKKARKNKNELGRLACNRGEMKA
jgi:hypothetical protein